MTALRKAERKPSVEQLHAIQWNVKIRQPQGREPDPALWDVINEVTGTFQELLEWGTRPKAVHGNPWAPTMPSTKNPFNNDKYKDSVAIDPITGEPVTGYRWFTDDYGEDPCDISTLPSGQSYEDNSAITAVTIEDWEDFKNSAITFEDMQTFKLHPSPLPYLREGVRDYLAYTENAAQNNLYIDMSVAQDDEG